LADADASSTTRAAYGIALHAASSGQPLSIQRSGSITIGATLIPGMVYVLSNTAGAICPHTDLISGDYFVEIGIATSTTVLLLSINSSATVATTQPGYLTQEAVVTRVNNAAAVNTTSINTTILDMTGYEGVVFIASFGTVTDGTTGLKAQDGADSGLSDAADLAGTSVTGATSNKMILLEIVKPVKQYIRAVVLRGGSTGAVLDGVIAIQYRATAANLPTTQPASVAGAERWLSPADGSA